MMKAITVLKKEDPKAFRTLVLSSIFYGFLFGLVVAYKTVFMHHYLSPAEIVLYFSLGTAVGLLVAFPLYRKVFSMLDTSQKQLLAGAFFYVIGDVMVLASYYYSEVARAAVFGNGFIIAGLDILFESELDNFYMKLYNYKNRARIASVTIILQYLSAGAILLVATFIPFIPLLIFILIETSTIVFLVIIWKHDKIPAGQFNFVTKIDKKFVVPIMAFLLLFVGMTIFNQIRSPLLEDKLGLSYVPWTTGIMFILTALFFVIVSKYTFNYSRIITNTALMLMGLAGMLILGYAVPWLFLLSAVLFMPVTIMSVLSTRHYLIKKVEKKETAGVIYGINLVKVLARPGAALVPLAVGGSNEGVYYSAPVFILLFVVIILMWNSWAK